MESQDDDSAKFEDLRSALQQMGRERGRLIPILQRVQEQLSYLPPAAIELVAEHLQIPASEVYGVASFYNQFRFNPPGRHPVKVCLGTACHVRGGDIILENFERKLQIEEGQTTPDREFSIDRVACVGCCALAPVAIVGETLYGKMQPSKVEGIVLRVQIEKEQQEREQRGHEPSPPAEPTNDCGRKLTAAGGNSPNSPGRASTSAWPPAALPPGRWKPGQAFEKALAEFDIPARIHPVGCCGHCYAEPVVIIDHPASGFSPILYPEVNAGKARMLAQLFLKEGDPRLEHILGATVANDLVPSVMEFPRFNLERRMVMEKCGRIDPEDIHDYIAEGGYAALAQALLLRPAAIIDEIAAAGLRGRGGAGFPTGRKWAWPATPPATRSS